jgi:hypothetical protein
MRSALFCYITQRWVVVLYRRFGTTYWSLLQGWRSPRRLSSWTSWPIVHPETSVQKYHSTLRNVPEERRSYLHRGESLKPRLILCIPLCLYCYSILYSSYIGFLVNFAAGYGSGIWILAYFGVRPFLTHCWLKQILTFTAQNFPSYVVMARDISAWLAAKNLVLCIPLCFRLERKHFDLLRVNGRIILERILKGRIGRAWTALIWPRTGTNVDFLWMR